jgi:hypothetical protein
MQPWKKMLCWYAKGELSLKRKFNIMVKIFFIFLPLDPDPDSESGSESRHSIESGYNPDPQLWFKVGVNFIFN